MTLISPCAHKAKTFWGRSFLMILSLLFMNVSCASYQLRDTGGVGIESLPADHSKIIVLHQGNRFVQLKSFELLQSEVVGFPAGQLQSDGEPARETTSGQVAREIHLYLAETPPLVVEPGNLIIVPLSSIKKVMVYDEDLEKGGIAVLKKVGLVALIVLGCALYVALIVLSAGGGGGR